MKKWLKWGLIGLGIAVLMIILMRFIPKLAILIFIFGSPYCQLANCVGEGSGLIAGLILMFISFFLIGAIIGLIVSKLKKAPQN
jgi:hypothetical protein